MQSNIIITGSWIALNVWDRQDFLFLLQDQKISSSSTVSSHFKHLIHIPYRGGLFAQPRVSIKIQDTPIAVLTAFACRLDTLENFLDITISALEVIKGKKRLILTMLNCLRKSSTLTPTRDPVNKWQVTHMIKEYKKKYKKIRSANNKNEPVEFKAVFVNKPFSRTIALNRAADELKNNELAVVLDVDMRVSSNFFIHCRTFARVGKMAYFPIPFVRHRPTELIEKKITTKISKKGNWDTSSHNTFAISSIDLNRIGKRGSLLFTSKTNHWGMETEDLKSKMRKKGNLQVMRMYDPSLAHHYHKTDCGSVKQGKICLGSAKLFDSSTKLISHWDEV